MGRRKSSWVASAARGLAYLAVVEAPLVLRPLFVINRLFWGFLCLLLCAPRLVRAPRPIILAALLCTVGEFVLMVPIWWPALLFGLKYNWTGKLFSILVSLLVVYGGKWVSPLETGLVRPLPGSLRAVGPVVVGLATVQLVSVLITQRYGPSQAWESF